MKEPPKSHRSFSFARRLSQLQRLGNVVAYGNYNDAVIVRELKNFGQTLLENLQRTPGYEEVAGYAFTKLYIPHVARTAQFWQ